MAKPRHDYDSNDFYELIRQLAMNGFTDKEIAHRLNLDPDTFGAMKNGNYVSWSVAKNKKRSKRMIGVLTSARSNVVAGLRSAYIRSALGGKKIHSKTRNYVRQRCPCNGEDPNCPRCGGTGWVTLTDKAVVAETETELAPNNQALATLLFHYDPDWRKVERNQDEDEDENKISHGVDISKWIAEETKDTEEENKDDKDA